MRRRGDAALALAKLEDLLKDIGKAVKREAEKQMTFDEDVVGALLRAMAAALVSLAAVLEVGKFPSEKLCRAVFAALAALLDASASLGAKRSPEALRWHTEAIANGLQDQLSKEADPVLSAWMFYDRYAKGLEDRPSEYRSKLPKLRAAALVAFRDALAAAHDLLEASQSHADRLGATAADRLLDSEALRVQPDDLQQLRPYMKEAQHGTARRVDSDRAY